MQFQSNPASIPFFAAAAISTALTVLAWRGHATPVGRSFALMMAGEAVWALFEALELVVVDIETKKVCFMLRATGCVTLILSLLANVLLYTGRAPWVKPARFSLVCAPSLLLLGFAWTNPWHHLYWIRLWNARINGHWVAMPVYGPLFQAHFVYCYVLVAIATFLLAQAVYRSAGIYRAQAAIMLFGVLLPWITNAVDMSRILGFIYVDTAAMSFGVTGVAFVPGLFRYRLLDLTPVAWAAVVKGIDDPVVVLDPLCRVVALNPAARKLIARQGPDPIGAPATHVFTPWPALRSRLHGIISGEVTRFELDGPETAPASTFDARASQLDDAGPSSGWVVVLRDITVHKRAVLERVEMLREQAARAQAEAANIAKDRFLATVSHELRTPLTPVLATVTAMITDPVTPESLLPVFEMIRRNVVLEVKLIDDLLDLSRIRRGSLLLEREIVDAHHLVHSVIDMCRDDLGRGEIGIEVDLLAGDHHVDADPIRFQQALWNLIKNAIKFTPAGGWLAVGSRNDNAGSTALSRPELIIEVRDTGIGIEPDVLPHIFDVLEQGGISATRRYGGLGLGLTITRSILEDHGGRLTADSPGTGLGSTFTIRVPTIAAPAHSDDDFPAASPTSLGARFDRSLEILLVEDNADTLQYLARLLTLRGHHVHTAADMRSALQIAARARLDVIVSDIELPDGSGLELMWSLSGSRPVPAIALSGFGAPADVERSHSAGFAVHLTKPVDFRLLEQAIQNLASGAPRPGLAIS